MITRLWRDDDREGRDGWTHARAIALLLWCMAIAKLASGQDSLEKLNQRWREAGTEPAPIGPSFRMPNEVAPYPGFWHCGTAGNFRYCPCPGTPGIMPYTQWIDPETGNTGYWRYDFAPYMYTGASACGAVPAPCIDGQGGPNHTQQGYGSPLNYLIPLQPQPDVNNYYPVPEAETGLGAIWAQFNTPPPAFPGTNYAQRMKTNPIWVTGYNYKKPAMDADPGCQAPPPPTRTPTRTQTQVTMTPTSTPTPAPNIYARYIIWAYDAHVIVGCGPRLFCPGNPATANGLVTRAQLCVYMYNGRRIDHPDEPLPECRPIFDDVVCQ